ncbi:MAG: rhomboid family intramembrane serine protease [Prevotella sp.]|nr:rhomboid family intramembrane serine protease [Prevotella sp.]MDD7461901.1 rhomboid family intramembrane serine protease [Prevotellaceae bacterium]MDY3365606.1 rhomboid family intramembrane serine protease [Prevotella sp.]MDY3852003.1 rhomboid family intramembrane serine protease [Prevotella sp.]
MGHLPTVTKNLLILNLIAYLGMVVLKQTTGVDLNNLLGLHFLMASDFRVYQLVSYLFMHAGFTHIFFNMFALWMFGVVVERVWGSKKFLFYYIACGVGAGLMQELAQFVSIYMDLNAQYALSPWEAVAVMRQGAEQLNGLTTVGASGAVYGILLAFGMLFPENKIFIFPLPVPIKAKYFVMIYAGIELFMAMSNQNSNVAHLAHLGGMLFGYLLIRYWRRNPYVGRAGMNTGHVFDKMKDAWTQATKGEEPTRSQTPPQRESDWEANARKQAEQAAIDAILDKIRRSGYDSLSREEKQRLFDQSNKR